MAWLLFPSCRVGIRPFEILILAVLAPALVVFSLPRRRVLRWAIFPPCLAVLLILVHLLVERGRSQMVPAYGLAVLLLVLGGFRARWAASGEEEPSRNHESVVAIGRVAGVVCLASSLVLLAVFPIFQMPKPTGVYAVGTTQLHLVDDARPETFTADPGDRRELLVQVWYPAEVPAGAEPAMYWEGAPLPLDHLALAQTNSYRDAPLADAPSSFPVLVFSHGYFLGYVSQNTVQVEELASHGYVVFSIAHPYEALKVTYPDGRHVLFDGERLFMALEVLVGVAEQEPLLERTDQSFQIWVADTVFVLDELERMNTGEGESAFTGKLDLDRVGVFGMSFGGAAASQVCLVDDRCKAGINLDGGLWGDDLREDAVACPFMVMYDEYAEGMNDDMYERVRSAAYKVTIEGSLHGNYTDASLMFPVLGHLEFTRPLHVVGSIDGGRMERILNAYILAFFDRHLKGQEVPLLDGPSLDYPEVKFESRNW